MNPDELFPEGLTEDLLTHSLMEARRRAKDVEQSIAQLDHERAAIYREIELLQELIAVRHGNEAPVESAADSGSGEGVARRPLRPPHPAVTAAIEELDRAGRPLHISELMQSLREQGVRIPGSGQQANLIAHMTRNPEIVRPSRGMYALASWDVDEKPPVKPSVRRRVRGKSKGSTRKVH